MKTPYDIRKIEKKLATVSYAGTALGLLGVAVNTWVVCSIPPLIPFQKVSAFFCRGGFLLLPALEVLFWWLWGRATFPVRTEVSLAAEAYFLHERLRCRRWWLWAVLWLPTFLVAILTVDSSISPLFLGISSVAAFLALLWGFEWSVLRKITLHPINDYGIEDSIDLKRARRWSMICWSLYWLLALGIYIGSVLVFRSFLLYSPLLIFFAANFVLRLVTANPFRPYTALKHRRITLRLLHLLTIVAGVFLGVTALFDGTGYNRMYIGRMDYSVFEHHSTASCDAATGVYTLRSNRDEFRILQLTDLHIGGSVTTIRHDRRAFDACYDLILRTQPDLVIITGDLVYPLPYQSFSTNNLVPLWLIADFMNNVGIPWTLVYGNHDTEAIASFGAADMDMVLRQIARNDDSVLLYAEVRPQIYGRYNQYLRIENRDGTLERVCFLVDSNDYVVGSTEINTYDSIHRDQIDWYCQTIDQLAQEEGRMVPSFVFQHIPFREFADAAAALQRGDPDAVYLFGENLEAVHCPDKDNGFFEAILEKGSTEAVFVGHDHRNYMGVRYRGVDLVYAKSIDFLAYPGISGETEQRGGNLIILDGKGGYRIEQIGCDIRQ